MTQSAHRHRQFPVASLLIATLPALGALPVFSATAFAQSAGSDVEARFTAAYDNYLAANNAGNADLAIASASKALELGKELFGENDQNTANLYLNHAELVEIQGKDSLAEQEYLAVLSIYDALYGEESIEHVPVLLKLGELRSGDRRVAYLQEALDVQRTSAPNDLLGYVDVVIRVALQLKRTEKSENGYGLLLPVIDMLVQAYGKDSPNLVRPLMAVAEFEFVSTRVQRYRRAIKILEDSNPDDEVLPARFSLDAGRALLTDRHLIAARRFLRDAHKVFSDEFGEDHELTAVATLSLGELELRDDRPERAEEHLLQSLEFFEGQTQYKPEEIRARTLLVDVYEQLGQSDDATPHLLALADLVVFANTQEYLPLVKPPPQYPPRDAAAGREGWVVVEYTVDESGRTTDVTVVESDASPEMVMSARSSATHYRYVPRVIDGETVAVTNIKTRIEFALR